MNIRCWFIGLGLTVFVAPTWASGRLRNEGDLDIIVPTTLESGHFYARPELISGQHLRLLLDTGGGGTPTMWISQAQADRLGLSVDHECKMGDQTYKVVSPKFKDGSELPDFAASCQGVVVLPNDVTGGISGQIVPSYFAEGVWTFDYPGQHVIVRGSAWKPTHSARSTPLAFKTFPDGTRGGWPRIEIRVDGETISMLLDTGATAKPTAEALAQDPKKTTHGFTAGSYISQSTMYRWIDKHPDWQVIENGDALFPPFTRMIRVPTLEVAGWGVGPVWFIERPDQVFHSMMASLMDKPAEGAIGGNILDTFRITIDYKGNAAWFECGSGCSAPSSVKSRVP